MQTCTIQRHLVCQRAVSGCRVSCKQTNHHGIPHGVMTFLRTAAMSCMRTIARAIFANQALLSICRSTTHSFVRASFALFEAATSCATAVACCADVVAVWTACMVERCKSLSSLAPHNRQGFTAQQSCCIHPILLMKPSCNRSDHHVSRLSPAVVVAWLQPVLDPSGAIGQQGQAAASSPAGCSSHAEQSIGCGPCQQVT